jgi:reactive intermediate/imine deaminase
MIMLPTFRPARSALLVALLGTLVVASGCELREKEAAGVAVRQTERPAAEFLAPPASEDLGLPFSEAVRVGDLLILSGQVGNLPGTLELAEGGIQGETRQALENIRTVLERHGSSMERVIKCTVMVDDIEEWPAMNEVYVTFFPGPKPARSALGADGLALDARVEIECWATVG